MRRGTRKAVVNLVLFFTVAVVLLYINSPSTGQRYDNFAWTKIRYVPRTDAKIAARGRCPGLEVTNKPVLVVARTSSEDKRWLDGLKTKYHLCVYTADNHDPGATTLQTPANRGHEAMAYLTFLIDNYEHLPPAGTVFVHGSQFQWHNDHPEYDNAKLLADLNINAALKGHGYHNLKCDWATSTCSPSDALPQGSYETRSRAVLEAWDRRVTSDAALPAAFAAIFGGSRQHSLDARVHLGRYDAVRSQCCAQFVVSRESVWQHTRDEYIAIRQWLLDGSDPKKPHPPGVASSDDLVAGRIISYLWHILFIRHDPNDEALSLTALNKAACPSAEDCYCKLYGRCGLTCPTAGHCIGQYRAPPNLKLSQTRDTKSP